MVEGQRDPDERPQGVARHHGASTSWRRTSAESAEDLSGDLPKHLPNAPSIDGCSLFQEVSRRAADVRCTRQAVAGSSDEIAWRYLTSKSELCKAVYGLLWITQDLMFGIRMFWRELQLLNRRPEGSSETAQHLDQVANA